MITVQEGEYIVWGCVGGARFATQVDSTDSDYIYSNNHKFRRSDGILIDGCGDVSLTTINVMKEKVPYHIICVLKTEDEYCEWKQQYIKRGDLMTYEGEILDGLSWMYCWDSDEVKAVRNLINAINEKYNPTCETSVTDVEEGVASMPIIKICR